ELRRLRLVPGGDAVLPRLPGPPVMTDHVAVAEAVPRGGEAVASRGDQPGDIPPRGEACELIRNRVAVAVGEADPPGPGDPVLDHLSGEEDPVVREGIRPE